MDRISRSWVVVEVEVVAGGSGKDGVHPPWDYNAEG
jgi:hypothetical protein